MKLLTEYESVSQLPVTVAGGLRHVLSSLARKPGSWVLISLRAWMFGVRFSVFVYR
jgi:hypothetical protein